MFEKARIGKKSILTLFLLIVSSLIYGTGTRAFGLYQVGSLNYQATLIVDQTIGGSNLDYAYSVINTSDGGFATAGYTDSYGAGGSDMWLVKTDATGEVEWDQYYGGTRSDYGFSIVATIDGDYALSGGTESFGAGDYDMWLVKTNNQGEIEWSQTFGGIEADYAFPIIQTSDEGFVIAGRTQSFGAGDSDMCLVKVDNQGDIEWNHTYGGINSDSGDDVIVTSDGGYAIVGGTESYGAGESDMWLVKTNVLGKIEWNQTYGGINEDRAMAVIMDSDEGYVVAGLTQSFGAGNRDMWLVKTDSSGQPEWNQTFGGQENDYADSLIATSSGGYALAGRTESMGAGSEDMWLVKTNNSGQMEWDHTFGGSEEDTAYSVMEISENEYVLVGRTASQGTGNSDLWLLKVKMVSQILKTTSLPIFDIIFYFIVVLALFGRKKHRKVI
ncbi:MAG: hypothetical protein ACXADY_09355 [Candidatus Hodarchaeales archaeon]|jgi:hypothetical protein